MAKKDAGVKLTEKDLARLENKISRIYDGARSDIEKTITKYWAGFQAKDELMAQKLDAGEITHDYYKQWRLNQIGRGQKTEAMRDELAKRIYNANVVANSYVNGSIPNIYAKNWNYSAYTIDAIHGGVSLTVYDENTIKRLLAQDPKTMPYYPPERAIRKGYDLAYSSKVINNTITRQILTGATLKDVADELQHTIIGMSRASALRSARTSYTSAQNGGRMACMESAIEQGVDVKKQWLSGYDNRVRESHMELNGTILPVDEPFQAGEGGLMFPADPDGEPSETYNCRCTLVYVVDGESALDPQFNTGSTEDFEKWEKEKLEEQGEDQTNDILTVDDAKRILEKDLGFDVVEDSIYKMTPDLFIDNVKQLKELEDRFNIAHLSSGSIGMMNGGARVNAYVRSRVSNPRIQNLVLCPNEYKLSKQSVIDKVRSASEKKWGMPCSPEKYTQYTVTHEYGHMIENYLISKEYEALGWTPETAIKYIDSTKKTRKAQFKWYDKNHAEIEKKYYREIKEIALKKNPDFKLADHLSEYGRTNHAEFFAEVFANSQCGKPNELGKAMQIWLKKKGY